METHYFPLILFHQYYATPQEEQSFLHHEISKLSQLGLIVFLPFTGPIQEEFVSVLSPVPFEEGEDTASLCCL